MPKPSSYDLCQKVFQAIELDGMSQNQAAMALHISRRTINLWCHGELFAHIQTIEHLGIFKPKFP